MRNLLIFITFFLYSLPISHALLINEIMPNPKGKDHGNEWIELYNQSSEDIDLTDWQLKTTKTHTLKSQKIKSKDYTTITNLKITLRNKNETLYLISPNKDVIQEISYTKAPSGLSYSKIVDWQWTNPTKNYQNPEHFNIEALILSVNQDSISIKYQNKKTKIKLDPSLNPNLIKALFKSKKKQTLLVEKNDNKFLVKGFRVKNGKHTKKTTKNQNWPLFLFIPSLLLSYKLRSISSLESTLPYKSCMPSFHEKEPLQGHKLDP